MHLDLFVPCERLSALLIALHSPFIKVASFLRFFEPIGSSSSFSFCLIETRHSTARATSSRPSPYHWSITSGPQQSPYPFQLRSRCLPLSNSLGSANSYIPLLSLPLPRNQTQRCQSSRVLSSRFSLSSTTQALPLGEGP